MRSIGCRLKGRRNFEPRLQPLAAQVQESVTFLLDPRRPLSGDTMATSNIIIDLSHHNGNVDLGRANATGIVG
ncbi:MAG TPA: hypothetical protein VHV29_11065, partial [Terriglobales bacterium]|nr:hypothetical protein [Terriglobales bacterium]